MSRIVPTPEIMAMMEKIRPYRENAIELKDNTPEEIKEMDMAVREFYHKETENTL